MMAAMTNQPRHLSKAPIVEALISFDFVQVVGSLADAKSGFFQAIVPDYPVQTEIKRAQVNFDESGSSGETSVVGMRCASVDEKNICAVPGNSFTCSRQAPYQTWESLLSEFKRLWEMFSSGGEFVITKAAVRFINKISIPNGSELFDSIYTYPKLAQGLPDSIFSSFLRLEINIPDPAGTLIITQGTLSPDNFDYVPIALDHDLQFPVTPETGDVWELLARARELKNQYFFASISPELLKEFE